MDSTVLSVSGAAMALLHVRVSGSLETVKTMSFSGHIAGITFSGQNDAMEKVSLGVSQQVGEGNAQVHKDGHSKCKSLNWASDQVGWHWCS